MSIEDTLETNPAVLAERLKAILPIMKHNEALIERGKRVTGEVMRIRFGPYQGGYFPTNTPPHYQPILY